MTAIAGAKRGLLLKLSLGACACVRVCVCACVRVCPCLSLCLCGNAGGDGGGDRGAQLARHRRPRHGADSDTMQ